MILGMSLAAFTQFHVLLSLLGIASGFVVLYGMWHANRLPAMTAVFLAATVATSATGFLFDSPFGPARAVGILSLLVLGVAILALYFFKLEGAWRLTYVVSAVIALYFNVFVAVAQTFQKVAFFHALAPTQKEPPFAIAQGIVFFAFIAAAAAAARKFHPPARDRAAHA
jgi:hypothetical protein